MPSAALSTTVPVSGGGGPVRAASAASSWAGVFTGSSGDADAAALIRTPAVTAPAMATAPEGTAHRARRENVGSAVMANLTPSCTRCHSSCRKLAVRNL